MAAFLAEIGTSIIEPLVSIWTSIIGTVPGIIGALIVLVFGYLVGTVLGRVVENLLHKMRIEKWVLEKTNITSVLGYFRLSHFIGLITKWYVFMLFLPPAASIIRLTPLSYFLLELARWIPQVILAVVIALIGVMAADYVGFKIRDTRARAAELLASAAKVIILVFTALIVLDQVGVRIAVAQTSFLIILSGLMLGVSLMLGIGFGLAFKDEAKGIIREVKRKL